MERARIKVGAVYRWPHDDRPNRVLIHDADADVVMCDGWRPHLDGWGLANLRQVRMQRNNFYPAPVSTVMEKATYLRTEPLTDDEVAMFRPDLPFAVMQCAAMQWPAEVPPTVSDLVERWRAASGVEARSGVALNASEIYLYPFGPKGGQKAGVRVKADSGTAFTPEELLGKAAILQAPHVGDVLPTQGVGLYRAGLHRGIPGYYLWGGDSKMHEHIADFERRQSRKGDAAP
ncbi:hypothetical protein ABT299_49995 [Spirillospora sp. NPDC000708]